MESAGVDLSFEYCALRYLLQWQRKEESLHEGMRASNPELPKLRDALRYFKVARNFKGLGNDSLATVILDNFLEVRRANYLAEDQQVVALAACFERAGFQYNVSAASKLLWLASRKSIIYDSRAYAALRGVYGHTASQKDYVAYCMSWRRAYKENKEAISDAVEELPGARVFLPRCGLSDNKLLALVRTSWFRERVFDIYLWERGAEYL
jgi:hypothetical protein